MENSKVILHLTHDDARRYFGLLLEDSKREAAAVSFYYGERGLKQHFNIYSEAEIIKEMKAIIEKQQKTIESKESDEYKKVFPDKKWWNL